MPPIALEKRELDELFDRVKRSVVVLIRSKDGNTVDFGTGFVVYVGRKTILISVDKSLIKNGESRDVRFYNNMQLNARVFMQKTLSKHAVLEVDKVPRLYPRAVTFSELEVTRENLFTVAAVHEKGDLGLMTGTLGNPNCRAVDRLGNRAYGSENKFAMSCHLAGPSRLPDPDKDEVKEPEEMTQLVGAAVFDMDCSVIGTIFCADPCSHDLKFAMKASYFVKNLEKYLKQNDQKINLSRGKKGSNLGTGLSIHHETTSESGSKKRGRTNTPRGGTGAGTSICMTQADNVEVVNKEQPRLHTYPVQGGMEGVRREAMQRALMRLVTQESDAAWRSSASSDAGIEANQCIKVFIARNTDEVGSDNSIAVKPFDLNHFFGGDGKIFGYRNLKISVWISAISFHVCADISFLEKSNGGKGITDLKLALLNIFGENLVEKDEFLQTFSKECKYISDAVMNGRVIKHSASDDGNSAVEIVRVELQAAAAAAAVLYSRLVPLILLLVEGSLVIDIKEHGWEMLLVVEKGTHESSRPKFQLLGFAAARHLYHYPESHLRISQILVLPPYQREYHVRHLIEAIGSIAISESVADVTIEHPPDYLQHMHCSIDCLRLLSFDPVKHVLRAMVSCLKANKMSEGSHGLQMVPPADLAETVWQKLKINLKQFLRCWETLMYLNLDAEDRESMDKMRACMYNRMKGEMLGRANRKQVASSLNEGTSLACWTKEDQLVENDMTPEEGRS